MTEVDALGVAEIPLEYEGSGVVGSSKRLLFLFSGWGVDGCCGFRAVLAWDAAAASNLAFSLSALWSSVTVNMDVTPCATKFPFQSFIVYMILCTSSISLESLKETK